VPADDHHALNDDLRLHGDGHQPLAHDLRLDGGHHDLRELSSLAVAEASEADLPIPELAMTLQLTMHVVLETMYVVVDDVAALARQLIEQCELAC